MNRLRHPELCAGDMFEAGWLPPRAAARALGCTREELNQLARTSVIRRRRIAPGIYLYDTAGALK